jgi:hypothetical protein
VPRLGAREACRRAFYPGATLLDPLTIGFRTPHWLEAMRMLRFVCQARRVAAHACAVRGGAAGAPSKLHSARSASHRPPCGDRTP